MPTWILLVAVLLCGWDMQSQAAAPAGSPSAHYLFVWTGDVNGHGNDFLAVIDADPQSPQYGRLIATLATDQQTKLVHHTEYVMPAGGLLFANDHDAGRTFLFDLHDPVRPRLLSSFMDVAGYMHPHSYIRLPDGHVLVSFRHTHDPADPRSHRQGALVELDQGGHLIRSRSTADPAFPNALLTPYSLVALPGIDRVLSTNSSMSSVDGH